MVSGSQLQVAKLAQICPAAPSDGFRVKTQVKTWAPSGDQWHQMVPSSDFLEHIILYTSFLKFFFNIYKSTSLKLFPLATSCNLEKN